MAIGDPYRWLRHARGQRLSPSSKLLSIALRVRMLELRNISKRFAQVLANDRVNIKVEPGTIHSIVGENGAGKSTAMRIAYGFYTADGGEILINDQAREIRTPHDAIELGIGMVHQHFMLVEPMTVAEDIVLGAEPGSATSLDL